MARPKQDTLPGVQKGIPELEKVGIEIAEIDEQSFGLRQRRDVLCGEGIKLLKKHGIGNYAVEDITMRLKPGKDKLSVSKRGQPEHEGDEKE